MISKRQGEILKVIIEEYIQSAKPIGSESICNKIKCSSATVRNEMVELENMGFLEKTHISSGRIPSEKGYRYYVDSLMKPKNMTGEDMLKLQTIFMNNELDLNDVITRSIEIISEMTTYTSVVLGDSSSERLKKVEVVPLNDVDLVAIVVTDKGNTENKKITLSGIDINDIKKTVDLINELVVGTPIDEVSAKLEYEIKPIIGKYVKQHEMIYNAFYNAFNDFAQSSSSYYFAGKTNILKQPEFNDSDKIRNIIDKFEDKNIIDSIEETNKGINIYIGSESKIDDDVTVIKTKYNTEDGEGTIAIIGPKRMQYNKVISLLEYIKERIER